MSRMGSADIYKFVSRENLHYLTGMHRNTINEKLVGLQEAYADGKAKFYLAKDALELIYKQKFAPREEDGFLDPIQEKAKLDRAKRLKTELEHEVLQLKKDEIQKKLVSSDEYERILTDIVLTFRSKLMVLPSEIAASLEGKTPKEIKKELTTKIEQILNSVGNHLDAESQ